MRQWCKRQFWGLMVCLAAVAGGCLWSAAADEPARPNVLVIITDQQHAGMLSCTGNRYLSTPAMDSLAKVGVRFERAYCGNPVCLPSRVSMMTGYLPSHFGIRSNDMRGPVPEDVLQQSLGWLFRRAGYRTYYGGKTHWPKGMTPATIGFDVLTRDQRDGLADACAKLLASKPQEPFLLVASFINPHDICYMAIDSYTRSKGKEPMYPASHAARRQLAEAMKLPEGVSREEFFARHCPPLPDNYEVPAHEPECITTDYLRPRPFRQFARDEWSDEQWRLHRWAYCRLTEVVDHHVGRVLEALRRAGLEQRTLVVLTSDHGDMDASHRLEHKSVLYEEAARIPLVLSYPGHVQPGRVDRTHLVSNGLDLLPTLCDFAGIQPPPGLRGRSLRPLAAGQAPPTWRDQLVVESRAGRMLRTERYKYNLYKSGRDREQLIDLQEDPGEMVNLAVDPRWRDVLEQHRARLRRWVLETGDRIAQAYLPDEDAGP